MPVSPSRRTVLASSVAGVAALGLVASQGSEAATTSATHPLPVSHDPALHAARRLTYGATPAVVAAIRAKGVLAWLDGQLANSLDTGALLHGTGLGSLPLPPAVEGLLDQDLGRSSLQDLQLATFARAAFGDNQVFEMMVELFSNHLSIFGPGVSTAKALDDQDVVRKHALGSFADMLAASAQSPAMLQYLDNAYSIGNDPNENYARELMELHTVGATAGYTQRDVHDAALALTGMTIEPTTGVFSFNPAWHYTGRVRVMGWSHPNNDASKGKDVALSLVSYLAHHPATSRRIATKLVRRFVSDAPPASLVASAAAVYRANDTAIVPVLKHIIGSAEFAHSWGAKQQRPYEWLTAAVRSLQLRPNADFVLDGNGAIYVLRQMGQAPFEWSPPNGYPDVAGAWSSTATVLSRWNVAQALVNGYVSGLPAMSLTAVIGNEIPSTAGDLVDRLSAAMFHAHPRAALKQGVLSAVGLKVTSHLSADQAKAVARSMAAMLLSSPEAMVR